MIFYRYAVVALGVFSFFVILSLLRMLWRKTCILHHRAKRIVAMDWHGRSNAEGVHVPRCSHMGGDLKDIHRWSIRWFCDACQAMGEHCWDRNGEWYLEGGKIVPDEKKWANRG